MELTYASFLFERERMEFISFCVDCFLNASLYTYTTYPLDGLIFEICAVQLKSYSR
jgi:hypothetical protein